MGQLDEDSFAAAIGACKHCGGNAFELATFIDRQTSVMLGERNDDGRWTHDGEKFIDGVYRIHCVGCRTDAFASADCPRCHRAGGLADAIDRPSRLAVPKRCPQCNGTELTVTGFAPAVVRVSEGRSPSPSATALLGELGFHVAHVLCDSCDWVAVAAGCPLCGGPGPLRARPG